MRVVTPIIQNAHSVQSKVHNLIFFLGGGGERERERERYRPVVTLLINLVIYSSHRPHRSTRVLHVLVADNTTRMPVKLWLFRMCNHPPCDIQALYYTKWIHPQLPLRGGGGRRREKISKRMLRIEERLWSAKNLTLRFLSPALSLSLSHCKFSFKFVIFVLILALVLHA